MLLGVFGDFSDLWPKRSKHMSRRETVTEWGHLCVMRKIAHESRSRKDGSELWPLCSKDQCPHMEQYLHSPWWDLSEAFSLFRSHPPPLWNESQVFCDSHLQGLEILETRGWTALISSQTNSLLHCIPLLARVIQVYVLMPWACWIPHHVP